MPVAIAEKLWPTFAAQTPGLDVDGVEVVATNPQTQVSQLVVGELDAIALFSVSAPGLEAAAGGRRVSSINWSPALPDLFSNSLMASRELIAANPDLVRRFTDALLEGLAYTLDHPEEAGQVQAEEFPETGSPEVHAREIEPLRPFCYGDLDAGQPLGHIDLDKLTRALGLLSSTGEITEDLTAALPPPGPDSDAGQGVVNFEINPGSPWREQQP